MEVVILLHIRPALTFAAYALLLAGCGGDDAETASAATDSATATAVVVADSGLPAFNTPAPQPAAPGDSAPPAPVTPQAAAARDSAMTQAILKAPVSGPVNVQALDQYQLSMEGLRKLVRAGQNLGDLQARRPELRDSMRLEAFDPNAIYQKLNSIPDVRQAIGQAGMTPREYATATAALMQAAMVRQMRAQGMSPPVEVNEANVRFVDENWDEIQQLMRSAAAQAPPRS